MWFVWLVFVATHTFFFWFCFVLFFYHSLLGDYLTWDFVDLSHTGFPWWTVNKQPFWEPLVTDRRIFCSCQNQSIKKEQEKYEKSAITKPKIPPLIHDVKYTIVQVMLRSSSSTSCNTEETAAVVTARALGVSGLYIWHCVGSSVLSIDLLTYFTWCVFNLGLSGLNEVAASPSTGFLSVNESRYTTAFAHPHTHRWCLRVHRQMA